MPSVTVKSSKSSLLARSGSGSELGGGQDDHLSIGYNSGSGYRLRGLVAFSLPAMGSWSRIVSATLQLRVAPTTHMAQGSSPKIRVARCTESWSPNSGRSSADAGGGGGWSTSGTVYPGPAASSTGLVNVSPPDSGTASVDITAIVEAWRGGSANYGVRIYPQAEDTASQSIEFWSHVAGSSSNRPTLVIVYEDTAPPTTPSLGGPSGNVSTLTPTMSWTSSDPDGSEAMLSYDLQVTTNADTGFASPLWNLTGQTSGIAGWSGSRVYAGPALAWGPTYRWRVRVYDPDGASPWATAKTFTTVQTNVPPTTPAMSKPLGGYTVAEASAIPVSFASSDANVGATLAKYDLEVSARVASIEDPPALSNLTAGINGWTVSTTYNLGAAWHGVPMYLRARVYDNVGAASAWSGWSSFKVNLPVPPEPTPPFDPGPYIAWGQAVLDRLAARRTDVEIESVRPRDAEVVAVVCANYGDRFRVLLDDGLDMTVRVVGASVSVSPSGWTVGLVTEREE